MSLGTTYSPAVPVGGAASSKPRSNHALIQKRPEIKQKKQVFFKESKERH